MLSLRMSGCAQQEPPSSSLAAELMSMSADDRAACLFAADAGRLSCPQPDCFAWSSSSGSSASINSAQSSDAEEGE